MIEGIIFDFDNTLVFTLPLHYQSYKAVFSGIGIDLSHSDYFDNIGGKATEIIPKMIGNRKCILSVSEIHERKKDYLNKLIDTIEIEQLETAKLLDVFYGKYKMAIGSAGSHQFIDLVLKKLNWGKYFDAIITGEDVVNSKPNPSVFLLAAQKMKVKPEDCIVFEDQPLGVEAAERAGMMWFDVNKTIHNMDIK